LVFGNIYKGNQTDIFTNEALYKGDTKLKQMHLATNMKSMEAYTYIEQVDYTYSIISSLYPIMDTDTKTHALLIAFMELFR
jgi:hypothetical protein